MEIRFEGFDELQEKLNRAVSKAPESTEKVIHNIGMKTTANMKADAPVDTSYMKDHIVNKPLVMGTEVHSQAAYSNYVDKGTRYMGAQPFFTPNVENMGKEAEKQLTDIIKEVLR